MMRVRYNLFKPNLNLKLEIIWFFGQREGFFIKFMIFHLTICWLNHLVIHKLRKVIVEIGHNETVKNGTTSANFLYFASFAFKIILIVEYHDFWKCLLCTYYQLSTLILSILNNLLRSCFQFLYILVYFQSRKWGARICTWTDKSNLVVYRIASPNYYGQKKYSLRK